MRRGLIFLAWAAGMAAGACGGAEPEHAVGHVLVKFKPEAAQRTRALTRAQGLNALLEALDLPPGGALVEPAVGRLLREKAGIRNAGLDLDRFFYLELPPGMSVEEGVRRAAAHEWVEYAEPDGIGTGGGVPNDPTFSSQWHHLNAAKPSASMDTAEAWEITQGSSNVVLAVLDTGLTPSADFAGRLLPGFNFVSGSTNTADDHGHGTAVAGAAAATGNNGVRVAGVDWNCRILPVKVLNAANYGEYSWWAQGIDFAVASGAKVINLSAGGSATNATLTKSITNAIARGTIFVTITHNDGTGTIRYPGNLTNVITVGATDAQDLRAGFSNHGPEIDLCAPGVDVYTVGRTGAVEYWWGTSFAAPLVAGTCCLLAAVDPDVTPEEARQLLCAGAEDRVGNASDVAGFDRYYGWGRLNAHHSLMLAQARVEVGESEDGAARLSWASPANASSQVPVEVQSCATLETGWSAAGTTNGILYETNRSTWVDGDAVDGARFYRLKLRNRP